MKLLRRLYSYLKRYKAWAALAFGSMIIFAVTQTIMIGLLQPVVDVGLTPPGAHKPAVTHVSREEVTKNRVANAVLRRDVPEGQRGWIINHLDAANHRFHAWWDKESRNDQFHHILVALFIVIVLRALASFFSEYAFQKVGLSTVRDLRNQLYERIIFQSHRFFSERSTGEMVSRVVSDADAIQAAVSTRMGDLFQESLTLFFLLCYVFWTNPELALITFIVAPVMVYPVVHFGRRLRGTTHRSQERMADMATLLEETIRGVRIVKAFTMERFEIGRFHLATKRHLSSNLKAQKIQALSSPVMDFVTGFGALAIFAYASHRIANGTLSMGALMAYIAALAAMYQPIKKLNKVNLSVNTALSAAERVFRMLDIPNEVEDKPAAGSIAAVGSGIRYENVSFQYQAEPVLREVDLTIAPGEIVAIVGGSGAGKSTFVNLLPRFYDVNGGRITVDGRDIRDVSLSSLRGLMGLVTQEVVLFNDTVRNNIAYGRGDAEEARVIEAAKAANAHDFISALPNGYDTEIGESGVLLSGGQRQRLAIARALFKDPPILILDEATSALDTESERLVQGALERLMQGRTTLVIAHRLSTIRSADKIVVLDRGAIVESGAHDELLARRGVYRKLYDLQFADDAVPTGAIA
ncbi:MAG: ATP-binding cassette domain-containing protein [Acidobacteria bacterium]|nr:ATP-binding cassette domain-containing protein [Acidobacteriota bacterium]MBV9185334.1 ATP-binding cassette domain-containing protein [Acidobacteriota bacterium]